MDTITVNGVEYVRKPEPKPKWKWVQHSVRCEPPNPACCIRPEPELPEPGTAWEINVDPIAIQLGIDKSIGAMRGVMQVIVKPPRDWGGFVVCESQHGTLLINHCDWPKTKPTRLVPEKQP